MFFKKTKSSNQEIHKTYSTDPKTRTWQQNNRYCTIYPLFSTAFCAYSTWKTLPSGENCAADKSYYK